MEKVLFLSAPLVYRIWGGSYFKDVLKVTESNENIGEMWTCSGLNGTESVILNGEYEGKTLKDVYHQHPELFNYPREKEFPILVKVIASNDRLSVQVHPDDEYAAKVENGVGKTEGWLILDHEPNANIIIGHNASNKEELLNYVLKDNIEAILNKKVVSSGEFYPINSGTIHAIGKGVVLLEVQQSSDITYRLYDYHRKDKNGKERETHVQKAMDVISLNPYQEKIVNCFKDHITTIWDNKYFKVDYYLIDKEWTFNKDNNYSVISVIDGNLDVEGREVKLGNSFIVTSDCKELKIKGNGKIVVTTYHE